MTKLLAPQENDEMFHSLLGSDPGVKLKPMNLGIKVICCDVSTGDIRPYVPENFQISIFRLYMDYIILDQELPWISLGSSSCGNT
ncbi:hypothetical protein AVEN_91516-1 [Araneus ventricosus]|uniref:Uncharacterized protein n=1 Tax=Araneus ventricosus TaxID=182803 RepID=A0A4Y2BLA9_ARAVE|nr:hypothetical protein AVEN_91516-1 [Araneus ventricosus]